MTDHIQIISAGAGSGKTYTITEKLEQLLQNDKVSPSGVIATTFTKLAASELQERVRQKLIEGGKTDIANAMGESLIGTVNGVCGELIQRFSFEDGLSPEQQVIEERDGDILFAQALEQTLTQANNTDLIKKMNAISTRLGIVDNYQPQWQNEVKSIVSNARANNMGAETVRSFAKESIASLLSWFPKATQRDLTKDLSIALKSAIKAFDPEIDTTQGSKGYFKQLEHYVIAIEYERLTWADWIRLTKSAPGRKSAALAEPIQIIASDYEKHPDLHEDLKFFINSVFEIAANSMSKFQELKRKMGLVDFVDQEQALLQLLDNPFVIETLSDELDLLMVDEFQDTSPIQLAVFIKLANLAKQVIWVGDIKQSIYGFRGADPELMTAVIKYLEAKGNKPDVLGKSWRSRPPLVQYVNNIFSNAFKESISKEQVVLEPAREDSKKHKKDPAVECWHLEGSNKTKRANALASHIRSMIEDNTVSFFDKNDKIYRNATYGDIAVLCRTNDNLAEVAQGMNAFNIPCEYKRSGLMATPEGCYAFACLRRLIDPRDTLACAEIITLSDCETPEAWLADRINWLQEKNKSSEWAEESHSTLKALKEERHRLPILSPKEIMVLALNISNIRKDVISWCHSEYEAQQRLGNIDLFIQYAEDYESQCESNNRAATASGLILYLQELQSSGEDLQSLPGGNAVQLVTHHRSKGLEWPIVIAMDLDSNIKSRLWGLNVRENDEGFQWEDPLAGRGLQYWPSFFGKQSKDIPIKDNIEQSDIGQVVLKKATEETKRLLYVSLTRPRDLLILPFGKKASGEWLNALEADWMLPDAEQLKLPGGEEIPTQALTLPEAEATTSNKRKTLYWLNNKPVYTQEKYPRKLFASKAEPIEGAKVSEVIELGNRIPFTGSPDMSTFGTCLHAIIASEIIHRDNSEERAQRIISDFGLDDCITPVDALQSATRFIIKIEELYQPINWFIEYPIRYINENNQICNGYIDLVLETSDGWVIIDHKSSPKARNEWEDIALSYSGQLKLYEEALEATGKDILSSWIHFAITGGLVSVIT